jgi:hypothetical protein
MSSVVGWMGIICFGFGESKEGDEREARQRGDLTANQVAAWRGLGRRCLCFAREANFSCTTTTHTFRSQQKHRGARIDLYFLGSVDSASLLLRGSVPSQKKTSTNYSPLIPVSPIHFHFPCATVGPPDRPIARRAILYWGKRRQGMAETMPKLHLCATQL